ncbi:hypothetical protein BDA96_01G342700 [Sorghum bicolor]|nr:hypothetical protein BDA96_01G342700 [Sorghum bicolor]KAG0550486.1 hypothetical protein BDA96_01G342700 [Sorghum bicolor]KAG0550487.1 hypothetical protein BDA96_01G342700 [Sorghum bicolor]
MQTSLQHPARLSLSCDEKRKQTRRSAPLPDPARRLRPRLPAIAAAEATPPSFPRWPVLRSAQGRSNPVAPLVRRTPASPPKATTHAAISRANDTAPDSDEAPPPSPTATPPVNSSPATRLLALTLTLRAATSTPFHDLAR